MTFSPFPQRSTLNTYAIDEAIRGLESLKPIIQSVKDEAMKTAGYLDQANIHMTALQVWNIANDAKRHLNVIDRTVSALQKKRAL